MSPFAGFSTAILVAGIAVLGVAIGALGGAIVRIARGRVNLGGLASLVAYAVAVAAIENPRALVAFGGYGLLTLLLSYLSACVVGSHAERAGLGPVRASLVAFAIAVVAGFADLLLFRLGVGVFVAGSLVVDAILVLVFLRIPRQGRSGRG